ncbi:MAG: hypothetical protein AAFU77_03550 [Myxococcota bacterium]
MARRLSILIVLAAVMACSSENQTAPISECKPSGSPQPNIGLAFPMPSERLNSLETTRVTVLFTDFDDVPATRTPEQIMSILSPTAEDFFDAISYGRYAVEFSPHLEWLRVSQSSAYYGEAARRFEPHRDWIQEAMDLADEDVDFSQTDLVLVMATPNATDIPFGPTWTGFFGPGGLLRADGNEIANGITSGADLLFWGGLWLTHEMGHSLGLVDLYSYSSSGGFTRPFSLMDLINSSAPEYLAYERWLLGWIDDAQVTCLSGDGKVTLTPVEVQGGPKAVVVPLSSSRVLVVESRRALGYDADLEREGAVIYTVDASIPTGGGPIVVANGMRALRDGDEVEVEGVRVKVRDANVDGDTVSINVD